MEVRWEESKAGFREAFLKALGRGSQNLTKGGSHGEEAVKPQVVSPQTPNDWGHQGHHVLTLRMACFPFPLPTLLTPLSSPRLMK